MRAAPAGGQSRGGQRGADRDRRVQRDVRVGDGQQPLAIVLGAGLGVTFGVVMVHATTSAISANTKMAEVNCWVKPTVALASDVAS